MKRAAAGGAGSSCRAPASSAAPAAAAVVWLLVSAGTLCAAGLALGLDIAPADLGRADGYRIVYIHVPATWAALLLYAVLVSGAALRLVTGSRAASMVIEAVAPTGALFALLTLWTGSLWSKSALGVWWNWDARLMVDLSLLVCFVAIALLRDASDDSARCDVLAAVLALAGAGITIFPLSSVALAPSTQAHPDAALGGTGARFYAALGLTTAGFVAYSAGAVLQRLRCVILERGRRSETPQQWQTWR